jgi:hypothetical protein
MRTVVKVAVILLLSLAAEIHRIRRRRRDQRDFRAIVKRWRYG